MRQINPGWALQVYSFAYLKRCLKGSWPTLTDHDMEKILFNAKDAGAKNAAYVLLRLPLEIADLFREWLAAHYLLKQAHIMNLVKQMRNGKIYDSAFRTRMKGTGVFADLLEQRFKSLMAPI